MRFAFIQAQKAHYPLRWLCAQLQVSPSGFYAWRRRGDSLHSQQDQALGAQIEAIYHNSRDTYGRPRVHAQLRQQGVRISAKRVARLMKSKGLSAKRRRHYRRTTASQHPYAIAPNHLGRQFEAQRPNEVWVGDITYIWTQQGRLYLAVLLDLHSRRVLGWSMQPSLDKTLCLEALRMALQGRRPGPGLLHHTDRGSQYASCVPV